MLLDIVKYGHPVLRKKGEKIDAVTPELKKLTADMLQTMHEAKGIGLAAQQIGRALQLMVIDVRGVTDRPSSAEIKGQPVEADSLMPLVLINPELKPTGTPVAKLEGCLSFPEIFAEVTRPESVGVVALDAEGKRIEFHCGGLLARVVQHETDHLQGILFIDRMSRKTKAELQAQLDELQTATKAARAKQQGT